MSLDTHEVDELPPVLQRRMARLSLRGWVFEYMQPTTTGRSIWPWAATYEGPPMNRRFSAGSLHHLLNKLVGYDVA